MVRILEIAAGIVLAVVILVNLKGAIALAAMLVAAALVFAFAALEPESRLRVVPFALAAILLLGTFLRRRLKRRNPRAAAALDGGGIGLVLGLVVGVVAALVLVRVLPDGSSAELIAGIVGGTVVLAGTAAGGFTGYWLFDPGKDEGAVERDGEAHRGPTRT
jgi:hypothetical protein